MKRVICLSWFKRLLDRLVTEEKEDSEITSNQNDQHANATEAQEEKERPTFRFPIITDAEIYGWDDDEEDTQITKTKNVPIKTIDEFETVPLYQNERWPGKDVQTNIHRAGNNNHQKNPVVEQEIIDEPIERKPIIKGSRGFSPSKVPSPIYGFSKNKPSKMEAKVEVIKEEINNFQEEPVYNSEPVEPNDELFTQQELDIPIIKEEPVLNHYRESIVEPEVMAEETIENETHEEEHLIEQEPEPEPVIDATNDEQQPEIIEKKKERVVPFNVLMLKSDRAKLSTKQSLPDTKQPEETKQTVVEKVITSHPENPDEENEHYVFPSPQLLIAPESQIEDTEWLESQSDKLEESLSHFGVQATVIEAVQGPTVTRFELTVGQGTKVSRVRNLTDDLKLTLAAKEIRIQAPIPGKSSIGIEIPNRKTRPVRISEVINSEEFRNSTSPLEAVLGLGLTGEPITIDLRKMPHGLIAGATGSGKSVCINSLLVSLLYKATPTDLKMMLIDPKMVELAPFNGIPHLISPVITDVKAATAALKWAVAEMERRYELLAHTGVRDIERYNKVVEENKQYSLKMPYLLIVIDELSDLMMMSPADVEVSIIRIAQKARACGIHLIIATQRPSVDVITGTIKANIPTRIAFSVSSQVDSRTIIDTIGAERLLGKGDMLYLGNGQSASVRLQGTFVTDDEIERIIEHVQREASPKYLFGQEELLKTAVEEEENDPLFAEACVFIFEQGSASTSLLQRNFSIGYNRAARLMDSIEKHGFISEQRGSRARDVFITEGDLKQLTEVTTY